MTAITRFAVPVLLAACAVSNAFAQGTRTGVACDDERDGGDRRSIHACEIREFTLTPEDSLEIDASPNGSVSVTGWDRDEVQVRAQIHSWSRDGNDALERLDEITVNTDGVLRAHGPRVQNSWLPFGRRNGGWNVSFEIMAPHNTDLWVESVNGRIVVAAITGQLDVETTNGGISLTNIAAGVRGRTVNGSITAELADDVFEGDLFDVRTTNGRIVMRIPESFSARFDIETVNGGVLSDFPVHREGQRNRQVSATLGSGGPLIRARTVNGGVQIEQL